MKLATSRVNDWIAKFEKASAPALILVYGPDQGGVMETASTLKSAYLGKGFDPLQYCRLADTGLADQPGLVADEAAAIPMFGDCKLVHVSGGGGQVSAAARLYLETTDRKNADNNPGEGALVIIEAGVLRPVAALRKLAEGHERAMALPCYLLDSRDVALLVRQFLERENLRIEAGALDVLATRLTTDRGVMQRELERLALYKMTPHDQTTGLITMNDINAIMGDVGQASFDQLIDNVALGRLRAADRALNMLAGMGTPASAVLPAMRQHFQTLHLVLGLMESGTPQNTALSSFRPALHFKRKPAVESQLTAWSRRKAARALTLLQETETRCRGTGPQLASAMAGQVLLRITRAAQR